MFKSACFTIHQNSSGLTLKLKFFLTNLLLLTYDKLFCTYVLISLTIEKTYSYFYIKIKTGF